MTGLVVSLCRSLDFEACCWEGWHVLGFCRSTRVSRRFWYWSLFWSYFWLASRYRSSVPLFMLFHHIGRPSWLEGSFGAGKGQSELRCHLVAVAEVTPHMGVGTVTALVPVGTTMGTGAAGAPGAAGRTHQAADPSPNIGGTDPRRVVQPVRARRIDLQGPGSLRKSS